MVKSTLWSKTGAKVLLFGDMGKGFAIFLHNTCNSGDCVKVVLKFVSVLTFGTVECYICPR